MSRVDKIDAFEFLRDQLYKDSEDLESSFPYTDKASEAVSIISEATRPLVDDFPPPTTVYLALSDKNKEQLTALLSLTDCHTVRGLMSFMWLSRDGPEGEWVKLREDMYTKDGPSTHDISAMPGYTLQGLLMTAFGGS